MKKVLLVASGFGTSPFLKVIYDGIKEYKDFEINVDFDDFWRSDEYDIYNIQWAEWLFNGRHDISDDDLRKLDDRLSHLNKLGKKLVITCHNLKPHRIKDERILKVFDVTYSHMNIFMHMGEYSKNLLQKQYPNASHVIIDHPVYDKLYKFDKDKSSCQKELGLSPNKINILCFGEFRNDEERELIIKLKKDLKNDNVNFVVPGFFRKHFYFKHPDFEDLRRIIRYFFLGIKYERDVIDDETTEKYFVASDLMLIQRLQILNSGNLPMGYLAGLATIGPNIGNVGYILNNTKNPCFNPQDYNSILKSIKDTLKTDYKKLGKQNKEYALRNWTTEHFIQKIVDMYNS